MRDLWNLTSINLTIKIFPVSTIYRIYPIHKEKNKWLLDTNDMELSKFLSMLKNKVKNLNFS